MSQANVTMTVEPFETNQLVYLAAVPLTAGEEPQHRLHFRLSMTNNGQTAETLEAIIIVLFINMGGVIVPQIIGVTRDIAIAPGTTETTQIEQNEIIPVPDLPLIPYEIRLHFINHDEPTVMTGRTRSHVSPTQQGSYRFFGHTDDMDFDEFFVQSRHTNPGSQFFGYDVTVQKWTGSAFSKTVPVTPADKNEHYFGYGKPLYAPADGTVISAINNIEENPEPGMRALMPIAETVDDPVSAISLVRLDDSHVATAVRNANGRLQVTL